MNTYKISTNNIRYLSFLTITILILSSFSIWYVQAENIKNNNQSISAMQTFDYAGFQTNTKTYLTSLIKCEKSDIENFSNLFVVEKIVLSVLILYICKNIDNFKTNNKFNIVWAKLSDGSK